MPDGFNAVGLGKNRNVIDEHFPWSKEKSPGYLSLKVPFRGFRGILPFQGI
jgi:hypothetical protein